MTRQQLLDQRRQITRNRLKHTGLTLLVPLSQVRNNQQRIPVQCHCGRIVERVVAQILRSPYRCRHCYMQPRLPVRPGYLVTLTIGGHTA